MSRTPDSSHCSFIIHFFLLAGVLIFVLYFVESRRFCLACPVMECPQVCQMAADGQVMVSTYLEGVFVFLGDFGNFLYRGMSCLCDFTLTHYWTCCSSHKEWILQVLLKQDDKTSRQWKPPIYPVTSQMNCGRFSSRVLPTGGSTTCSGSGCPLPVSHNSDLYFQVCGVPQSTGGRSSLL